MFDSLSGALVRYLLILLLGYGSTYATNHFPTGTNRYSTQPELRTALRQILADSILIHATIGIKIVSLKSGNTIFEQNSKKLFHPASTLKLLTTAAAIHFLGKNYRFLTTISANGVLHEHTLRGDLVIRGSGDPLLTVNDFDSIAAGIKLQGIQTITGDLIGDRSLFDTVSWGEGWMWDDEPNSDEAFISPLTVEGNSTIVTVTAGRMSGDTPSVVIKPSTGYLTVQNKGITSTDTLISPLTVNRNHGENIFTIQGRIAPRSQPCEFSLSVAHPDLYFLNLFRERLQTNGIKFNGKISIDTVSGNHVLIRYGHTIDSVLHFTNKTSNNIAAENLLRAIGVEQSGSPGSAPKGIAAIKLYLVRCAIDTAFLHIADGSGVSWYNIISPEAMVTLLISEYHHPKTFSLFYESLPIGGNDGTLKNRFRGTPGAGNVHAKTGSLSGVSSLAGYVRTADNQMIAFCIMCDHYPESITDLRKLQDSIIVLLTRSHFTRN